MEEQTKIDPVVDKSAASGVGLPAASAGPIMRKMDQWGVVWIAPEDPVDPETGAPSTWVRDPNQTPPRGSRVRKRLKSLSGEKEWWLLVAAEKNKKGQSVRNHWILDEDQSSGKRWSTSRLAARGEEDETRCYVSFPKKIPASAVRRSKSGVWHFIAVSLEDLKGAEFEIEGTVRGEDRVERVAITPFNNKLNLFFKLPASLVFDREEIEQVRDEFGRLVARRVVSSPVEEGGR